MERSRASLCVPTIHCYPSMDSIKVISGQSLVLSSYFRSRSEGSVYGMLCTHNHMRLFKIASVANLNSNNDLMGNPAKLICPILQFKNMSPIFWRRFIVSSRHKD